MKLDENFSSDRHRTQLRHEPVTDIIYLLVAILSLSLNLFMVFVTTQRQAKCRNWPIDVTLMLLVSFFDSLSCLVATISQFWKFATNHTVMQDGTHWCHFNATVGICSALTALSLSSLLAFIRYLAIVRGHKVCNRSWSTFACFLMVFVWFVFVTKDMVSTPRVSASGLYCTAIWGGRDSISIGYYILMSLVALPPGFIILFCYGSITLNYRHIVLQMRKAYDARIPRQIIQRLYGLFFIMIAYSLTILPEYFNDIIFLSAGLPFNFWADAICKTLIFSITLVNATFALLCHEDINKQLHSFVEDYEYSLSVIPPSRPPSSTAQLIVAPSKAIRPKHNPNRTSTFLYLE